MSRRGSLRRIGLSAGGPATGIESAFLVAVLMLRDFAEDRDVESALFGTHTWSYVQGLRKEDPALAPHWDRLDDGYFLRGSDPARTGVSGLLVGQRLSPWSIAENSPSVWHHRAADRPLPDLPLPSIRLDPVTGAFSRERSAVSIHEVLGLAADWPGFPSQPVRKA